MMITAEDGRAVDVILSDNGGLPGAHSVLIDMQTTRPGKYLRLSLSPEEARAVARKLQIIANVVELANISTEFAEKHSQRK